MAHSRHKTTRKRKTLVLLGLLFAIGLRTLYVPLHLAQEEHFGAVGQPFTHADHGEGHAHHEHEHDDDHVPHPALDHECDLVVERIAKREINLELFALLLDEGWSMLPASMWSTAAQPLIRPPDPVPRESTRPRGPPALS